MLCYNKFDWTAWCNQPVGKSRLSICGMLQQRIYSSFVVASARSYHSIRMREICTCTYQLKGFFPERFDNILLLVWWSRFGWWWLGGRYLDLNLIFDVSVSPPTSSSHTKTGHGRLHLLVGPDRSFRFRVWIGLGRGISSAECCPSSHYRRIAATTSSLKPIRCSRAKMAMQSAPASMNSPCSFLSPLGT